MVGLAISPRARPFKTKDIFGMSLRAVAGKWSVFAGFCGLFAGGHGRCILTTREASKKAWAAPDTPTLDWINTGSLQRIADATEKMASSYDAMESSRNYYRERTAALSGQFESARRRISSLKGVITKMRNRGGK